MPTAASPTHIRVLVADDEDNQRAGLAKMIQSWGFVVETAFDGQDALEKVTQAPPHVLVTDLMMPRMDGFELLKRLGSQNVLPPTIVLTAFGNIETAVQTTQDLGAFWFLEKPIQPSALKVLLERVATQSRMAEEAERLQRQLLYQGVLVDLVGTCSAMQQVFSLIRQVAPSKAAVLVTGESGTGKELVARAIHHLSPRRDGPFVAINCAALPETLMESELFGHEKGAFTGAVERRAGCFELASGGTLLLDELAEMPAGTQAKLLRVLEERKLRRLGARTEVDVDVRVLAATNRDPDKAVAEGHLRADLYYRLNVFHIAMPPLREHMEDLPAMAEVMIEEMNQKHGRRVSGVASSMLDRMMSYDWPGNARELRNSIERAVVLCPDGAPLDVGHLPPGFGKAQHSAAQRVDASFWRVRGGTTVDEAERALILRTLEATGQNKTRAAEILGVSLKTLHNKLKEYNRIPGDQQA